MNAASIPSTNLIPDNGDESDSDTNSDEIISDYYQQISSSVGNEDTDPNNLTINGYHHQQQHNSLINGHDYSVLENGVRSLDLSDDEDQERESEDDGDDEEEERRVEMESAMRRAFEEDESRRNTPLSSENAVRVMEAMRGVSFLGSAPEWVRHVPEDGWVNQLQRLRQPPRSS